MKKTVDGDVFLRTSTFVYGLLCLAGGLFLARQAYNIASESSSIWIIVAVGIGSLIILFWGLLLITAGLFPKNRRLQLVVEQLDASNDLGFLSLVLAAPIYVLVRLMRHISSDENRS